MSSSMKTVNTQSGVLIQVNKLVELVRGKSDLRNSSFLSNLYNRVADNEAS